MRPSLRHLAQGEAVAGKGFLFARIATLWGEHDAYDARTLADYRGTKYRMLRLTELFELAKGVLGLSKDRPFVILGDLNSGHGDREYDLFLDLLALTIAGSPPTCRARSCRTARSPIRIGAWRPCSPLTSQRGYPPFVIAPPQRV